MRYLLAILIGRAARVLIRFIRPGGGSALPGLILSKLAPKLLAKTFASFADGVIVVTGSAGKSTTTKMLVAIARAHGKAVFTNPSTANITQGFYSAVIERSNLLGAIPGDVAILEMDEGHAASLTEMFAPRGVAILNVLEDQLDRFVDPALVRKKLSDVAKRSLGPVVLNADDQNLLLIAKDVTDSQTSWFGLSPDVAKMGRAGLGVAATYLDLIERPETQTEITNVSGQSAEARVFDSQVRFELPNRGLHYATDAAAALEMARRYLGTAFEPELAAKVLTELPPVFARGEIASVNGEDVEFILVQNPSSFQLNLDNLLPKTEQIMLAIGRDVHDPSWLWTVDLTNLTHANVVSGYNFAEIALRLSFDDIPMGVIEDDLEIALEQFFALPSPSVGHKTVIFSADAMRRTRRILGFNDPESVDR
jgi:UDP-N-acetylmuramyl tripeptide synthase